MAEALTVRKTWAPGGKVGTEAYGLRCPQRVCRHFRVIYARPAWGGWIVQRECR